MYLTNSGFADAQHMADLAKIHFIIVIHSDYQSLPFRQACDSLRQCLLEGILLQPLKRAVLGTFKDQGELVVGVGPGFTAGEDVHLVIETLRGRGYRFALERSEG